MKRYLLLVLCLILTFSLLACSSREKAILIDSSEDSSITESSSSDITEISATTTATTTQNEPTTTAATSINGTTVTTKITTASKTTLTKPTSTPPTMPSNFLPEKDNQSAPEDTTPTESEEEPTISDAYNLYIYALYQCFSNSNMAFFSVTEISNSDPVESWCNNIDYVYFDNIFNMRVWEQSTNDRYNRNYFYDGTKMFLKSDYDDNTNENICYPLPVDQLFNNYFISNDVPERFLLDEVISYTAWQDGNILIKFNIEPVQTLSSMESEIGSTINKEDVIINKIQNYTCNVSINSSNYRLEGLEIWYKADCTINGDNKTLNFHTSESFGISNGLFNKEDWTKESIFVENPL